MNEIQFKQISIEKSADKPSRWLPVDKTKNTTYSTKFRAVYLVRNSRRMKEKARYKLCSNKIENIYAAILFVLRQNNKKIAQFKKLQIERVDSCFYFFVWFQQAQSCHVNRPEYRCKYLLSENKKVCLKLNPFKDRSYSIILLLACCLFSF